MIETNRLHIRIVSLNDAPFIFELLNSPAWLQFIGDRGIHTLEDARQYIRNVPLKNYAELGFGPYLVQLKPNNAPIGLCGLFKRETLADPDIGFAFLPEYIGSGYGYETASAIMDYSRNVLGINRLLGITDPANHKSIRLLEKLGLRFEKRIRFKADSEESLLFATGPDNNRAE
jgi:RimJ/RimL family protein N-acetyltransferase